MAKQLTFTFKGKEYTLEYTRRTVRQMEDSGFIASEVGDKPMQILRLFSGDEPDEESGNVEWTASWK